MTSPAVLPTASFLDPALPDLAATLSAHPPGTDARDHCHVRFVDWVPHRRCCVVQEIRSATAGTESLVAYEVTPSGTTWLRPAEDHALPGLAPVLDPRHVQPLLAEADRAPAHIGRITPVAYRPAVRAVVAYDVTAGSGPSRLYVKVLAHGSARYAAAAAAISASWAARSPTPAPVPRVVAHWEELGAVVQREAPGRVLSGALRDGGVPVGERLRYAGALGRLLAGVHETPHEGFPRWTPEDELSALETLLPPTYHADPAAGRSLAALLDRLADRPPGEADLVFSHGAFRTGQVLVDAGALSLLDLDTVSACSAARDMGNALAYLAWAGVRGALRAGLVPVLEEAFRAGYADVGNRPDERALAWWTAAGMAKIAGRRYRSLTTAEWRYVPALLDRAVTSTSPPAPVAPPARERPPRAAPSPAPVDPLDCHRMTDLLRALPVPGATEQLLVLDARTIAVAEGRRRVVRYDVAGLGPHAGVVRLIGKIYTHRHRSSIAHENLRLLGGGDLGTTPCFAVPPPVCHIPALRMVLYREVAGAVLDRLPHGAAARAAGSTGQCLAGLHASGVVLPRRMDLVHELLDVEEWARRVGDVVPAAGATALALADVLAAAAALLPATEQVPVHKDLHAGHVLVVADRPAGTMPDRVVVIDLDEARMGDPALDVAHLTTYLETSPWPEAEAARQAFLDGYGPLPGPSPDLRTAFFSAYTAMKIAKQLVTGRGPVLAPSDGPGRAAAVSTVLRRGLACLHG